MYKLLKFLTIREKRHIGKTSCMLKKKSNYDDQATLHKQVTHADSMQRGIISLSASLKMNKRSLFLDPAQTRLLLPTVIFS